MAAVPWHYVIIYDVTYVNETALLARSKITELEVSIQGSTQFCYCWTLTTTRAVSAQHFLTEQYYQTNHTMRQVQPQLQPAELAT